MSNFRKSDSTELQSRNNLDHQRVFDPELHGLFQEMLAVMRDIKTQLQYITEEYDAD